MSDNIVSIQTSEQSAAKLNTVLFFIPLNRQQ